MKIGLVSQSCDTRTGIGRTVNALAGQFLDEGHEVVCSSQNFEGQDKRIRTRKIPQPTSSKGVHKIVMRMLGPSLAGADVDVVHTFGVGNEAHVVSAQSCHRAGMEFLRDKRWEEPRNFGFYDRVSLSDEARLLTSNSTRRIVAVSKLVKSQIEDYYHVDSCRIVVIPNGVDAGLFLRMREEVDRARLRTTLGIPQQKFVLLFVGNEFGRKGLRTVLHGLRAMRDSDMHLLVVGSGDVKAYRALAARLRVDQQVSFLGGLPNPESIYFAADVFLLPSLYEPFGIVILEAMSAGVPVIASRKCGVAESMHDRKDILFLNDPDSTDELSNLLQTLRSDEKLAANLSKEGIERIKEFSWREISRRMLNVYGETIVST